MKHKRRATISEELGVDSTWDIDVDFTKGALSGRRGVVVVVRNRKTGRQGKAAASATTKADARRKAIDVARELMRQLGS